MNFALRVALLLVAVCFPVGALAQETEAGTGLICDEADQLARYMDLVNTKTSAEALKEVNGDTHACGVVNLAYVRGPTVSQVRNQHGTFDVVEITVVAANLGRGLQPVPPIKQYTLFKTDEVPA